MISKLIPSEQIKMVQNREGIKLDHKRIDTKGKDYKLR